MLNLQKYYGYMAFKKILSLALMAGVLLSLASCHSGGGNDADSPTLGSMKDSGVSTRRVLIVISSIPFPSNILDTLNSVNAKFQADLLNPANCLNLYSGSSAQAANLGLYGADLAYVISYEQFDEVGIYMKVTKYLADNIGIPLAFTQDIIERCERNQNNKDSLSNIVFQSYSVIDQTLKHNQRDESEVLVLTGGWVEGVYLTLQGISSIAKESDKQKVYHILFEQKEYAGKLLALLNSESSSSKYCNALVATMQDIKSAFDAMPSVNSFTPENIKTLTDKVKAIRSIIVKGNS